MRTRKRATDHTDQVRQKGTLLLLQASQRVLNTMRIAFLRAFWVRDVQEAAEASGWHTAIPIYAFL